MDASSPTPKNPQHPIGGGAGNRPYTSTPQQSSITATQIVEMSNLFSIDRDEGAGLIIAKFACQVAH
jgi:hypothetical protein